MQFAKELYSRAKRLSAGGVEDLSFDLCRLYPVSGLTVDVSSTPEGIITLKWNDGRPMPTKADSSSATPPDSGLVTMPTIGQMFMILNHLCFSPGKLSSEAAAAMISEDENGSLVSDKPLVLYLQRQSDRASMRRVKVVTDSKGQLQQFHVYDSSSEKSTLSDTQPRSLMIVLCDMCTGPYFVVRTPMW